MVTLVTMVTGLTLTEGRTNRSEQPNMSSFHVKSVRTAYKTQHFSTSKINWLMLFKEITAVHSRIIPNKRKTLCEKYTQAYLPMGF
jgi:hypothetical protein